TWLRRRSITALHVRRHGILRALDSYISLTARRIEHVIWHVHGRVHHSYCGTCNWSTFAAPPSALDWCRHYLHDGNRHSHGRHRYSSAFFPSPLRGSAVQDVARSASD